MTMVIPNIDYSTFRVSKIVVHISNEVPLDEATAAYQRLTVSQGFLPLKEEFQERDKHFETVYTLYYADVGEEVLEDKKACTRIIKLFQVNPYLKEIRYPQFTKLGLRK